MKTKWMGRAAGRDNLRSVWTGLAWLGLAWAPLLTVMVLAIGLGGCSSQSLGPSKGGIPKADAAAVSAVVAQTRAQFPELSATGVNYLPRDAPAGEQPPQLVLKGAGVGISPGIQVSARVPIECELYLNKPGYDRGYAKLVLGSGKKETWRIVANDRRGREDAEFEFIYLLASPRGELWYLVLIGGEFERDGTQYRGIEGTLIVPAAGGGIGKWTRAYKIDFGSQRPTIPAYQKMVAGAGRKFKNLRRAIPDLEAWRKRVALSKAQLELMLNVPDPRQRVGASDRNIAAAKEKQRLDKLLVEQEERAAAAGRELIEYYGLRKDIARAYAQFVRGNAYTWAVRPNQQQFYDEWKEVELQHPEIDNITKLIMAYLKDSNPVEQARADAMATVRRQNNWDKDPSRAAETK